MKKEGKKSRNNKGQITIFVIIGIVIVATVGLLFFISPSLRMNFRGVENPREFIKDCMQDSIEENIKQISVQGGFLNVNDAIGYLEYENEEVAYLCYTSENEELCTTQKPMLKRFIENEIKDAVKGDLENCFQNLEKKYSSGNYNSKETKFQVEIKPSKIDFLINKEITITKKQETEKYNDFSFSFKSPMWDFVIITQKIIMQEVNCVCQGSEREHCGADLIKLAKNFRNYEIDKHTTGTNENIYKISEIKTKGENKFLFSIRNCVRLP